MGDSGLEPPTPSLSNYKTPIHYTLPILPILTIRPVYAGNPAEIGSYGRCPQKDCSLAAQASAHTNGWSVPLAGGAEDVQQNRLESVRIDE